VSECMSSTTEYDARCVSSPSDPDAGATSVEYAIMVSLVAAVVVGSVTTFGLAVSDLFLVPCEALAGC
jgi:Flp pilus assembly pilin Flp